MKVFISWSGEFSRKAAECLSRWIQIIIQTVDVFYSPDDIEKGENWNNRLSEELEQSNFGIVCLTPENVMAPWILFEAGALSKATNSRVSAIMLGVTPSDVKGPLARLQNTACDREDFFRLFQSINNSSDVPLKPEILKSAFDHSWEGFMNDIGSIVNEYSFYTPALKAGKNAREERNIDSDALQEILRLVRNLDNNRNAPISSSALSFAPAYKDLIEALNDGITVCLIGSKDHLIATAPILHKYKRFNSDAVDINHMRHDHNAYKCIIHIPKCQINAFKEIISELAPEIDVIVL